MNLQQFLMQDVASRCGLDQVAWKPINEAVPTKTLKAYERFVYADLSLVATPDAAVLYLPPAAECGPGAVITFRCMVSIGSSGTLHIHSTPNDYSDVDVSACTTAHEDVFFVSDGVQWMNGFVAGYS